MTVVAQDRVLRGYDPDGRVRWQASEPNMERYTALGRGNLVVVGGTLYDVGYDLFEIDPQTGASEVVRSRVRAHHVAATDTHLLLAGDDALVATPLEGAG